MQVLSPSESFQSSQFAVADASTIFQLARRGVSRSGGICISIATGLFPALGRKRTKATAAAVCYSTSLRLRSLRQTFEWPFVGSAFALVLFAAAAVCVMGLGGCAAAESMGRVRIDFSSKGASVGIDFAQPVDVIPDGKAVAR